MVLRFQSLEVERTSKMKEIDGFFLSFLFFIFYNIYSLLSTRNSMQRKLWAKQNYETIQLPASPRHGTNQNHTAQQTQSNMTNSPYPQDPMVLG